ncbi:PrgI family protein [Thomasclavelia sp.]
MEIKVNKEIRNYTEAIYFGLSLRQFIFSVLACLMAVGLYFLMKPYFGLETLSWLCILGATPFALLGFISYQGMNAEEIAMVAIRSLLLSHSQLSYAPVNLYYEILRPVFDKHVKEDSISHVKKLRKIKKERKRKI